MTTLTHLIALTIDDPNVAGSGTPTEAPLNISGPTQVPTGGLFSPGHGTTTGQIILQNALTIIIILAIVLALFFLIWGGIQWITSSGDKNKVQAARNKIIYAIIGLLVVFFSFFIISIIGQLFNIDMFPAALIPSACPVRGQKC